MELFLTAPNLTVCTTEDMGEAMRLRDAAKKAAAGSSSDDDFLADVDDDEDEVVQPIDSCGDFFGIDDNNAPPPVNNRRGTIAAASAAASKNDPKRRATVAAGGGNYSGPPPFVDPLQLLSICVQHTSARIPLCGTLCKHWSLLRFVEYSERMLPLWQELVVGLCSPSRNQVRRDNEDRGSRLGMLQRILSLKSAIPININEFDSGDAMPAAGDASGDSAAAGGGIVGDNNSLVSRSIVEGETAVFQTLTRKSQDVEWSAVLPNGHSLLTLACACSQRAIVEVLLQQPQVDVLYEAPGHGTALDIVRMNGGNAQVTALVEARVQQMDQIRAAAETERLQREQNSHVDSLRKRLQGRKRATRAAAPPKWIEAMQPTGPPGFDPDEDAEDWTYDRESKPEVMTGPVLDVCNTLREHWELLKNRAGESAADVLSGSTIGEPPKTPPTATEASTPAAETEGGGAGEEGGDAAAAAAAQKEDGGEAARDNDDDEVAATAPPSSGKPPVEDEDYLLDGTALRQDLCATLMSLGTRIIVEGKDPKEKVLQCVTRLLSEGSNVPLSVKLARIFMFRIVTVDFAPCLSGQNKWALRAAQRGDLEALDTLLRVDKLWREEHEVVELVAACVRYNADPTSAWSKIALCLVLLRHQKQLRFGTYRDHLRPLWEELVDVISNPTKINTNELVHEQRQLAEQFSSSASSASDDYHCDGYKRDRWQKKAPESALRFELLCRLFANPNFYQLRHDVEITQGISWFSRACRIGDLDFVKASIAYVVCDVNKLYSNKSTPLMQAIVGNQMEVVRELCACSDIDLFVEGPGGATALDLARQMKRDTEMVDVIMSAGEKQAEKTEAEKQ